MEKENKVINPDVLFKRLDAKLRASLTALLDIGGTVNTKQIGIIVNVSDKTAKIYLKDLRDKWKVIEGGGSKDSRDYEWKVKEEFLDMYEEKKFALFDEFAERINQLGKETAKKFMERKYTSERCRFYGFCFDKILERREISEEPLTPKIKTESSN